MLSLFSESKISLLKPNEQIVDVAVSNTINAIIAVAVSSGIRFFSESGEIETANFPFEGITVIRWHPSLPLITFGTNNGMVVTYSHETKHPKETSKAHGASVTCLNFHSSGRRLISGDESGKVCIFKDSVLRCSFEKGSKISHMCFADLSIEEEGKTLSYPVFFFGTTAGLVCLADENTHSREICKVSGSIKVLTYFEQTNSVIVISSTLLVLSFKITLTEKLVPDKKMKLALAGSPEELMFHWVQNNILVLCSKENVLRLWHVEADENYILASSDFSAFGPIVNDKIVSSTYCKRADVLCAGSFNGKIFFWKNLLPKTGPKEREQWKPLLPISTNSELISLHSSNCNNLLVARNNGSVSLILETFIKGRFSEKMKALQVTGRHVIFQVNNEISKAVCVSHAEFLL